MRLVKSSFIASHLQSNKNETECGIGIPITYVVVRKENVHRQKIPLFSTSAKLDYNFLVEPTLRFQSSSERTGSEIWLHPTYILNILCLIAYSLQGWVEKVTD